MKCRALVLALTLAFAAAPLQAEEARDILISAAFAPSTKAAALARLNQAFAVAEAACKRDPRDQNARLQRALAASYRGKLSRSRSEVIAAREEMERVVAADPRNPEAHMALAGWHLGAVLELGPMLARSVLGARSATGLAELDRALALGGGRASIAVLASLHRIQLDPADVAGPRRLAEIAVAAHVTTSFDRAMQRQAVLLLPALRPGNGRAAAALAKGLLPFGRVK